MDRCFYSIQLDSDGNKNIHLFGNVYFNDVDITETNYRHAEWTGMYFGLDEIQEYIDNFDLVNEKVAYLSDITEGEALEISKTYFNGNEGVYLHLVDINNETKCGDYYFET